MARAFAVLCSLPRPVREGHGPPASSSRGSPIWVLFIVLTGQEGLSGTARSLDPLRPDVDEARALPVAYSGAEQLHDLVGARGFVGVDAVALCGGYDVQPGQVQSGDTGGALDVAELLEDAVLLVGGDHDRHR